MIRRLENKRFPKHLTEGGEYSAGGGKDVGAPNSDILHYGRFDPPIVYNGKLKKLR